MKKVFALLAMALVMIPMVSCADSEEDEHNAEVAQQLKGVFNDNSIIDQDFWMEGNLTQHTGAGVITIDVEKDNKVKLSGYIKATGQVVDNQLVLDDQEGKQGYVRYKTTFSRPDLTNLDEIEFTQTILGTSQERDDVAPKPFKTIVRHKLIRIQE